MKNEEVMEAIREEVVEEKVEIEVKEPLLFTTPTCPNCKMAKMLLDKAGVEYTTIDAEDNVDLVNKFNIKKAPTLLVPKMGGYDIFENVSFIKQYIESRN